MGADSPAAKRAKRIKWLRWTAIAFVVYTLTGFFIVPAIIKWQMRKQLPGMTKRSVEVKQVKVNPLVFSLTIRGLALKEPDGTVFSSFDEFYINFQPLRSLFHWTPSFKELIVIKPFVQVTLKEDGTFNFANLLPPQTNAPPANAKPKPPPPVFLAHLLVTNAIIKLADLSRKEPFHSELSPINVNLTNLATAPDRHSPYSFRATSDSGETFMWQGRVSVNPLGSAGTFRLGGLKLSKYSSYSHEFAKFEIADGLLDVAADYSYDGSTNMLDLVVSNAAVYVTGLDLKDPKNGESLVKVPALSVTGTDAEVLKRTAHVRLIKSSGGSILGRQDRTGGLTLLAQIIMPAAKATTNAETGPMPVAIIDEIAFDDYTFHAVDEKPEKPVSIVVDQIAFNLKGVSNITNAPVTSTFSMRFQETGFINMKGTNTILPPSADVEVAVTNLDLRAMQSYVEQFVKLAITGCTLDVRGRARFASSEPGAPLAQFTGDVAVNRFGTTDDVLYKSFTKWDALTVNGIDATFQPIKLRVDEVKVVGLNTSLIIGPDRRPNVLTILRTQLGNTNAASASNEVAVAPAPAPAKTPMKLDLDAAISAIVLENASIHYSDESLQPHCNFDVQEFGGSIKGISLKDPTPAEVDVKGIVDARSPFSVTGKVKPIPGALFADVTVTVTNTELTAFTPYMEKFAGHPLQKGKFATRVHYLVQTNLVKGENNIYIDQLTLGPKNDSPDATGLPVKLGVALLKDRNGLIHLDVPVQGELNDPKFRIGPIIWQVVGNILVKAATSPFALLGAAFGGGDELSYVEFEPAQATLVESETKKLDTLAKALYERPAVSLEIRGSVDPTKDQLPLAQLKVDQEIKSLWIKEQTDAGKPAVAVEDVQLEPGERDRLLKNLYKQKFGRYEPTPVSTNAVSATDTNSIAARLAAMPKYNGTERGSSLLMNPKKPVVKTSSSSTATAATTAGGAPRRPIESMTRTELELMDMEDQLVRRMVITGDDWIELMHRRAMAVQAYLLKSGQVTDERVFIIAPKTVDASFKGEDRVNLSLN
jgi:hypothetical protein